MSTGYLYTDNQDPRGLYRLRWSHPSRLFPHEFSTFSSRTVRVWAQGSRFAERACSTAVRPFSQEKPHSSPKSRSCRGRGLSGEGCGVNVSPGIPPQCGQKNAESLPSMKRKTVVGKRVLLWQHEHRKLTAKYLSSNGDILSKLRQLPDLAESQCADPQRQSENTIARKFT